jgi:rhodanese-related sulfurtransferase
MSAESYLETISVIQLKDLLDTNNPPLILDVREAEEVNICALPNFVHIPLGELSHEWNHLPRNQLIVTLCHHGYRSLQAALFLKNLGFDQVANLTGGIHAWADQVDPSMKVY